jgi:hypothetical protein
VTSEISSSASGVSGSGAVAGESISPTAPVVVAARDIPAMLRNDRGFFGCFPLEARVVCDMTLLLLPAFIPPPNPNPVSAISSFRHRASGENFVKT